MKKQDFIKKSDKDLQKLLIEKRAALQNFRFGVTGSNVANVKEGKTLKKDIARIMTALKQKELVTETE